MTARNLTQLAEEAGITLGSLVQAVRRGTLPATKVGRSTMVEEEDWRAYLAARGLKTAVREADTRSLSQVLADLPAELQEALLEGIRQQSPKPFADAVKRYRRAHAGEAAAQEPAVEHRDSATSREYTPAEQEKLLKEVAGWKQGKR